MAPPNWIVCERTSRWVATLRHAFDVESSSGQRAPRFVETRNLADATDALNVSPTSFVSVEVRRQNLVDVLPWLAKANDCFCQACFVALVDRSFDGTPEEAERDRSQFELVKAALHEAGAAHVARSSRNLRVVFQLAQRQFDSQVSIGVAADSSPIQRVWESLPWQAG